MTAVLAWIVARFAGMGALKIAEFVGTAIVVAMLLGLIYSGIKHIEDIGAHRQAALDDKVLAVCTAQRDQALKANATLGTQLGEQNDRVKSLAKVTADALVRADMEEKARLAQAKLMHGTIVRLEAIAKGPPAPTKEKACEDSRVITGDLVRDLVQLGRDKATTAHH